MSISSYHSPYLEYVGTELGIQTKDHISSTFSENVFVKSEPITLAAQYSWSLSVFNFERYIKCFKLLKSFTLQLGKDGNSIKLMNT